MSGCEIVKPANGFQTIACVPGYCIKHPQPRFPIAEAEARPPELSCQPPWTADRKSYGDG